MITIRVEELPPENIEAMHQCVRLIVVFLPGAATHITSKCAVACWARVASPTPNALPARYFLQLKALSDDGNATFNIIFSPMCVRLLARVWCDVLCACACVCVKADVPVSAPPHAPRNPYTRWLQLQPACDVAFPDCASWKLCVVVIQWSQGGGRGVGSYPVAQVRTPLVLLSCGAPRACATTHKHTPS